MPTQLNLAASPQPKSTATTIHCHTHRYLDRTNPEIAKFVDGFTMVAWVRWNDGTASREQPPLTMGHEKVSDFFKLFHKLEGHYLNGDYIAMYRVEDWKLDQKWHHVALSFGPGQGQERFSMWVDGRLYGHGGEVNVIYGYPSFPTDFLESHL